MMLSEFLDRLFKNFIFVEASAPTTTIRVFKMVNTLIPATAHAAFIVTALFAVATPAFSQAPTDAQRNAIRSECRSDYEAHCSSVPPGGEASLQCLQKNMSSLSGGNQTPVPAVEAPAAPNTDATPDAPKTESPPAAAAS